MVRLSWPICCWPRKWIGPGKSGRDGERMGQTFRNWGQVGKMSYFVVAQFNSNVHKLITCTVSYCLSNEI